MIDIKQTLLRLSHMMSVSGAETTCMEELKSLALPFFDTFECDAVGNMIFHKKSGRNGARKLLIDAHFDEIGMIVTGIEDGGFLRVAPIGGLDARIMQANRVIVYGKQRLDAVVASTPPHLQNSGDSKKLPQINELLIDTGYDKETLEKLVPLGTPVGFTTEITELMNGRLAGKAFDNKACVAAALSAVSMINESAYDITLLLSAKEETSLLGGKVGAYATECDLALVLDVNLAHVPNTPPHETVELDGGPSISLSAVTDRTLTRAVIDCASRHGIKHQTVVEISSTGTNANIIPLVGLGCAVAVVSVPLKNMHTATEVISLGDIEDTARLIAVFAEEGAI